MIYSRIHNLIYKQKNIRAIIHSYKNDTLINNSSYLILATFILSVFGFFFWVINARLFNPTQIGLATTLISITGLITSISMLGFNSGIIRFVPNSKDKNSIISTALTITGFLAFIMGFVFIFSIPILSPKLLFIRDNIIFTLILPFLMFVSTINAMTDSVFNAFLSAKYILFIDVILSITKLIGPFLFLWTKDFAIFYAFLLAVTIAMFLSLYIMKIRLKLTYRFLIKRDVIAEMWKYSLGNYIAGMLGMLSSAILPIIITNYLDPQQTAYYYMPSMIISMLLTIPRSVSTTLLAEGSHTFFGLRKKLFKSLTISYAILIPAVLVIVFFGKYILLIFGKGYFEGGMTYLNLSSLAVIPACLNYIIGAILQILKRNAEILLISFINCVSTLLLTFLLISKGLIGIGYAGIIGQLIVVASGLVVIYRINLKARK